MGCNSSSDAATHPSDLKKSRVPKKLPERHGFNLRKEKPPHGTTSNSRITDLIVKNSQIKDHDFRDSFQKSQLLTIKYNDVDFPPTEYSLGQKYPSNLKWSTPQQFIQGEPTLLAEQFQVKQGKLLNHYFACAIQMLCNQPDVFKRIMENEEVCPTGIYGIWLCVNAWKCITIDELIPVEGREPAFTSSSTELIVPLLEKAYAKALGDYSRISTGLLGLCVSNFTGCPYEYLNKNSDVEMKVDEVWDFINQELEKGHLVAISNEINDRNENLLGKPEYSYQVLSTSIVSTKGDKKERLIKVANPWHKYDWTGKWSQNSKIWTPQLKQKLGYNYQHADFWINIEDSCQNFKQVCSCKYQKESIYSFCRLKYSQQTTGFKGVFLTVDIKNKGYLTVSQKDHRFFDAKYKYGLLRLIVCEISKEDRFLVRYVTDYLDCTQNMSVELNLDPGVYYLAVESSWMSDQSRELVVSYYGQHGVVLLEDLEVPKSISNFTNEMILLHQKHTQKERIHQYVGDTGITRTTGTLAGYVYYHYKNESKVSRYLYQTVTLKEKNNIMIEGQEDQSQFSVRVDPGEDEIVKLKVDVAGNGSFSYSTKIQFYIVEGYSLEKLRELCHKTPTKTKKREMEGKPIQLIVKTYSYSGGIAMLYQNKMDKYAYVEELTIETDNLVLENEKMNEKGVVDIELEPHSEKLLSFVIEKPGEKVSFRTNMSFYLNTPEFQF